MIFTLVLILHVIVCMVLFGVILIQQGKGANMGAAFGTGGSQTVFGGSGAGNFLTRTTWVCAALFFSTSLILAYKSNFRRSVVDNLPEQSDKGTPGPSGTEKPDAKAAAPSDKPGAASDKPAAPADKAAAPGAKPAAGAPAKPAAEAPAGKPAPTPAAPAK